MINGRSIRLVEYAGKPSFPAWRVASRNEAGSGRQTDSLRLLLADREFETKRQDFLYKSELCLAVLV